MARTSPVPLYTTTTSSPAPFSANKRALSTTSPGSTDSVATNFNQSLTGASFYYVPENNGAAPPTDTLQPVGTAKGTGWALEPVTPFIPTTADGYTIAAGNWTVVLAYSNSNAIGEGTPSVTHTVILFCMSSDLTTVRSEIGRVTGAAVTYGTSVATQTLTIAGAQTTFGPDEKIYMEVFATYGTVVGVGGKTELHTNSSTATRVTGIPAYTIQYNRTLTDSIPLSDTILRHAVYARTLTDSVPLSDTIQEQATFRRLLADTIPTVGDNLARQYTANRGLAESIPLTDNITRLVSYHRGLNESIALSDNLGRQATYSRVLQDNLTSGGGTVTNNYYFGVFE